ncbi:MAG: UbiX family flavin prenyltransferase [Acidobacteriaceae bacterium]|nr:UbiX family flavin prenyltransferase [Acidobacteriaceae bacterium]
MRITVALTGASGAILAQQFFLALESDTRVEKVHLVASEAALRVLAEESGISGRQNLAQKLLGFPPRKTIQHPIEDVGAAIASGSYPLDAMVVIPCSMGTLAGIAHGTASNLIGRAADVCLKERRRLVLCVRETPLSLVHLRNMTAVTEAGATVFPVVPAFYAQPQTMEEASRHYVHRVLAHIGLAQPDAFIWGA